VGGGVVVGAGVGGAQGAAAASGTGGGGGRVGGRLRLATHAKGALRRTTSGPAPSRPSRRSHCAGQTPPSSLGGGRCQRANGLAQRTRADESESAGPLRRRHALGPPAPRRAGPLHSHHHEAHLSSCWAIRCTPRGRVRRTAARKRCRLRSDRAGLCPHCQAAQSRGAQRQHRGSTEPPLQHRRLLRSDRARICAVWQWPGGTLPGSGAGPRTGRSYRALPWVITWQGAPSDSRPSPGPQSAPG
jgi:hypothetical protein